MGLFLGTLEQVIFFSILDFLGYDLNRSFHTEDEITNP
jgi:hypothetical protein